jgi:hypothetical protein
VYAIYGCSAATIEAFFLIISKKRIKFPELSTVRMHRSLQTKLQANQLDALGNGTSSPPPLG